MSVDVAAELARIPILERALGEERAECVRLRAEIESLRAERANAPLVTATVQTDVPIPARPVKRRNPETATAAIATLQERLGHYDGSGTVRWQLTNGHAFSSLRSYSLEEDGTELTRSAWLIRWLTEYVTNQYGQRMTRYEYLSLRWGSLESLLA